ncbi:MAG: Hsp33 family molecular chaperone HslO [Clostridiales bacterium]|nr:Hsp33 family molecular chaperone HslO [Clostridiales bacterium]
MSDHILRATAASGKLRAFFADTRDTVGEARRIHKTSPVVSAALGRLLTAAAMMGLDLKNPGDLLTLVIKGDGPVGTVLATADGKGNVKGYAGVPYANIPPKPNKKLDVSGIIGTGTLNVIKDTGIKEPYSGSVELQTGEIAEDIAYYFSQSQQIPSAVALGVLVNADLSIRRAGGFIIQLMPGAEDSLIDFLEDRIRSLGSITTLYENGYKPESLARELLRPLGCKITDKIPVHYTCNCNKERVKKALISLGSAELNKIADEDKSATVNCHFCSRSYKFNEYDLRNLAR